ncbi:adenosylcobinamide-phosphate synthase CbiB [Symbiobacterium terraclitae]|uniref:adenosylcobinamide-phosphate synthase CbiB n=1 Tax=Symbiobacterium terraclitae TaxID=557451 RepID=UPI0035B524E0
MVQGVPWVLPLIALALDAAVGDPAWLPHPVVLMGRVVRPGERWLRSTRLPLRAGGTVLALLLPLASWGCTWLLIRLAAGVHPWLGLAAEAWLFSTCLAARSLAEHALAVYRPLGAGDLAGARRRVGLIVGRDTEALDAVEVTRAAVETVAESTCDGVIAPLFWGLIGGAPLAMAYKAVNTLDSMVGHRDERYREFGWASARLDDLANLAPARLSALLLALAGLSPGALGIALRDARLHPSPNSGWPEAAMAGLLGVRLGGLNSYGGVPERRAYMGDPRRPLEPEDIPRAVRWMWLATVLGTGLGALALWKIA